MKISTSMKSLVLMTVMLVAATAAQAKEVTTTTAGTLYTLIGAEEKYTITELKVSGPINGEDILFIREMAGAGLESGSTTDGKLASLDISGASIEDGGEYYKTKTKSYVAKANTIGEQMFNKCKQITSLVLPAGIVEIEQNSMSSDGPLVTVLDIPAAVTAIGNSAFTSLKSLETVTFASDENLKTIGNSVFSIYDGVLANITLPNSVETIGNSAFQYSKITSFRIPASLVSIGNQVFQGVTTLAEITELPATLETIGDNTFQNTSIAAVTVNSENPKFIVDNNVLYDKEQTIAIWMPAKAKQTSVILPSTVKEIKSSAFFGCEKMKTVCIPEGVTTINGAAFKQSAIVNITLPATVNTFNGTSQFEKCENLAYFCMKGTVEKIPSTFLQNCPNLSMMVFESTTVPKFFKKCFDGCADNVIFYAPEEQLADYQTAVETGTAGSSTGPATDKNVTYLPYEKVYDFCGNNIGHAIGSGTSTDGNLAGEEIKKDDVTFTCTDGNTPTRYFNVATSGNQLQVFKNGTFTLTADAGRTIKSVTFTFTNSQNGLEVDKGTYSEGTWTGDAASVTFSASGSRYIYTIDFVTDEATAVQGVAEQKAEAVKTVKVIGKGGILIGNCNIAGQQVK